MDTNSWWWGLLTIGSSVLAFPHFCSNLVDDPPEMIKSEVDFAVLLQTGRNKGFRFDDISSIDHNPPWLDVESLKRGQKFANDFYFGISMSEMISLYLLFADQIGRKPLIYTNKSNTVYTAFKRYLSTTERVKSWYETDVLDKNSLGYKNLKAVYFFHRTVSSKVNSMSKEELDEKTDMKKLIAPADLKDNLYKVLKKDTKSMDTLPCASDHGMLISQYDMAMTQFGFLGLLVLYPERFGVYGTAQEGIADFIHLWRYLGHMLGIEDQFNLCQGSDLDEIKMKMRVVLEHHFKPHITTIDSEWEHMSRVMTEGVSLYTNSVMFETSLIYLFNTMDVPSKHLYSKLTWSQKLTNYVLNFVFKYIIPYRWPRVLLTTGVKRRIERVSRELSENEDRFKRLHNLDVT